MNISLRDLLESGVHFGHQTRRWNPKMKPYIYGSKNGIHIIDLQKTARGLVDAARYVTQTVAHGGTVLFVGMAFVDFYTMPRTYTDDQYLSGALGMYLTYINLFIFILRLIIAIQGGGRRN